MDEPRNSPVRNSIDRISSISETLIHHIMSFMDMTDVVPTCVLSKRWRNLWISAPVLNFDFNKFPLSFNNNNNNQSDDDEVLPYEKFIKFVDHVFFLRDLSDIQRVNLVCGEQRNFDISTMTGCVTTWVLAATRNFNTQELFLDISGVKISWLPQYLFTCSSLVKLQLNMGDNSNVIVLPASMDLPRLTFMELDSLPLGDVNMKNMIFLKCPVLESLIIDGHLVGNGDFVI